MAIYTFTFLFLGEGEFTLGEALMFRAGSGGNGSMGGGGYELVTQVITSNTTFVMPDGVKDNHVYVRIFGGGGAGYAFDSNVYGGGGGGWMNNGWVTLGSGSIVDITIGAGGNKSLFSVNSGGITSFGTYLSANGGSAASSNGAGSGGAGGGACSGNGGTGYQFGGGGASYYAGNGGQWGGKGGNQQVSNSANAGVNTISIIDESDVLNSDGIGYGRGGYGNCGGGGGYGANGGNGNYSTYAGGGGGGGYGAAGYGGDGNAYWSSGYVRYAGGGGSYGHGATYNKEIATYGGGGASANGYCNGANGICLIWYYKKT